MLTRIKGAVSPKASEVFLDNGTSVEDAIGSGGSATGTSTATVGELFEFGDIDGSGFPGMTVPQSSRFIFKKVTSADNDIGNVQIATTFNQSTAGESTNVNAGLLLNTTVNNPGYNYIWGLNSILTNNADDGEQVSVSGTAFRDSGTGHLWAGHFNLVDRTGEDNTGKQGLVGIETGISADGGDGSGNRVIIDAIGKKAGFGPDDAVITIGVRSHCQKTGDVKLSDAFWADNADVDYSSNSSIGGKAFNAEGSYAVGIDLKNGTYSRSAIRMSSGDQISFNDTDAFNMRLDASSITLNNDGDGGATPSQKYRFDMNRSAPTAPVLNAYVGNPEFAETVSTSNNAVSFASAQIEDTAEVSATYASDSVFTISADVKRARISWNFAETSSSTVRVNHEINLISAALDWRAYGSPVISQDVNSGDSATGFISTIVENTSGADQQFQLVRQASSSTTMTTAPKANNNVVKIEVLEWA